jgi:hypothetical protein
MVNLSLHAIYMFYHGRFVLLECELYNGTFLKYEGI